VQTGSGARPASYSMDSGGGGFYSGVKRPWPEADDSSQSSGEFKNSCGYTSTPQVRFHSSVLS